MEKKENLLKAYFHDKNFLSYFIQKNHEATLITSNPEYDMIVKGYVSGDKKIYDEAYLFEKDAVFSFLDKMICECNKKTDDVFWITAR